MSEIQLRPSRRAFIISFVCPVDGGPGGVLDNRQHRVSTWNEVVPSALERSGVGTVERRKVCMRTLTVREYCINVSVSVFITTLNTRNHKPLETAA